MEATQRRSDGRQFPGRKDEAGIMSRSLSKKQRFDIFKRDAFVCQYCGRTPPAVVLECDHMVPVSGGGTDEPHNLITACFDCNRGKAAGSLGVAIASTADRAAELAERMEQAKAYEALLRKQKRKVAADIEKVSAIFSRTFPEWCLSDSARNSVRTFLKKLALEEVLDAMEMACTRRSRDQAFRYFCGICWKKIKEPGGRS
jgi:hypothetical protein